MTTFGINMSPIRSTFFNNTPLPTADWLTWDGSNDGAVTNIATAGGTGAQDIVAVSDTEAILTYRRSDNEWHSVVLDVNEATKTFEPIDTNTSVRHTGNVPVSMVIFHMTGNKFMTTAQNGGNLRISLFEKSGKTLTILDEILLNDITYNFYYSAARLNDTKAVWFGGDDGNSDYANAKIIDITGDVITTGTANTFGTTSQDRANNYCGVCPADDGAAFWACSRYKIFYGTYNAATLAVTWEEGIGIDSGLNAYQETDCVEIDNNTVLVRYEEGTTQVNANIFSWDGSAISRGAEVTDIFDGNNIFGGTGCVTSMGNKQVMFSGRMEDESPKSSGHVVLNVDDSNIITTGDMILRSTVTSDHTTISAPPSGLYVFLAYQDEDSGPDKQIGTRILQGF